MARSGGAAAAAVITVIVLLKTAGGLLALAMVMPWGQRLSRRAVSLAGLGGSAGHRDQHAAATRPEVPRGTRREHLHRRMLGEY
jgi:hypothetical protein